MRAEAVPARNSLPAPVEFSEDALSSAGAAEDRFRYVLDEVQRVRDARSPSVVSSHMDPIPLVNQVREVEKEFTDAMDDDFNTPRALAALFTLTRGMNVALKDAGGAPGPSLVNALGIAEEALWRLGSVLGGLFEGLREVVDRITITPSADRAIIESADPMIMVSRDDYDKAREVVESAMASGQPLPPEAIRALVVYRAVCRDKKDWATADAIRAWLTGLGVVVDDTGDGVRWYVKTTHAKIQRP